MAELKESVRLIFVDVGGNNNKFWEAELYEDGHWDARWGRVGSTSPQSGSWTGESKFRSKIRAKEKKGYTRQKTLGDSVSTSEVGSGDLNSIAQDQIATCSTVAKKLIDRLVKANIHQITANTQITLNKSGVFETPLGIVTQDGIDEATVILDKMYALKDKTCPSFYAYASEFLKTVPQKVGRNVKSFVDANFSDDNGIRKQKDLLDSLAVSFKTVTQNANKDSGDSGIVEEVFNTKVTVLKDKPLYKAIEDNFYRTKKSMHHYGNVKVANIYEVTIGEMEANFDRGGWGNVEQYYHGTGIANCLSIMKSGLKTAPPSSAQIAGKLFGNGVYGANCSSKSLGYSLGRWGQRSSNNSAWLFVCDFAMGKTYYTKRYGQGGAPNGYDSISALATNTGLHNDEFIVYDNAQVNIRYLIECSV